MFRNLTAVIGLIFAGFVLGLLFHVKSREGVTGQIAPIPKAAATTHEYRHTPHAAIP